VTAVAAPAQPTEPTPSRPGGTGPAPHRRRWDAAVVLLALAGAYGVTHRIWADPVRHTIGNNSGDHAFFEWLLGYGAWVLTHGADPFFADVLNAPVGVNLAVNTSITVSALLFSPVTMLLGPSVSFVLILTLNLAGGAVAWYWLLSRRLGVHPAAAAVAGLFGGFAPGFVSHANGHLNWSAAWVGPVLLMSVLTLHRRGRWRRHGLILGVLVAIAFSVAAEGLFFTALACGVFLGTWALHPATRTQARAALPTVLAALGVAAAVAGALLAYPMYMHFAGPQSFHGTGFKQSLHAEDVAAYLAWPTRSIAGALGLDGGGLAPNRTEETSFFGIPLVAFVVAALVLLRRGAPPGRRATLRALAVTGGVFTVLSFGPRLKFFGDITDIPLPYALLARLPLFDAALPARLALVVTAVVTVVLGFAAHRLITDPPRRTLRVAGAAGLAAALLPVVPIALLSAERTPIPAFIADGTWRRYVAPGRALTAVPLTTDDAPDGQRWQAAALADAGGQEVFRIPAGYFLGPGGYDGRGRIGAPERETTLLFVRAAKYGLVPAVDEQMRATAKADLAYWRVDAVILADRVSGAFYTVDQPAVLELATRLWGRPERVQDVWLWRPA
jgi:hypothetical protein